MTSANVILYRISKDGQEVAEHREHMLCKSHLSELLKFQPPEALTIQPHGLDEHEAPWEGEETNLKAFLINHRIIQ